MSQSGDGACEILRRVGKVLEDKWGLTYGADSLSVMQARGCPFDISDANSAYAVQSSIQALGHVISNNNSISDSYDNMKRRMQIALARNWRPAFKLSSLAGKPVF